jgi:hypothetical protein
MAETAIDFIKSVSGASSVQIGEVLQELWSGYGSISRVYLNLHNSPTAILKHIEPPTSPAHPRGWNTAVSHQRKLHSYEVEANWYRYFAHRCSPACTVPKSLGVGGSGARRFILLQDLDIDYPRRCCRLSVDECKVCLAWLAGFHACFLHEAGIGLWPTGTYWHLATRADEYDQMKEGPIKASAPQLDRLLNSCQFTTLVHGDAKVANFCFSADKQAVAAVDFQYVGRGCGIKDVVYFLGSCLTEKDCEHYEDVLLDFYFSALSSALSPDRSSDEITAVENEWRGMYAIAWTDFYRFLLGWMPMHQKINRYTGLLAGRALEVLQEQADGPQ